MKTRLSIVLFLMSATLACAHEGDVARQGAPAPKFAGKTIDGTSISLEDYRGKVVLLVFFSLQSVPSLRELEYLERDVCLPGRPEAEVPLVIGRDQTEPALADLNKTKGKIFRFVADPKRQIYNCYATEGVPRTYVIGRDGIIRYASLGFDEWEIDRIKKAVGKTP